MGSYKGALLAVRSHLRLIDQLTPELEELLAVVDAADDDQPDRLIQLIHAELTRRNPNADPGDVTIVVQDDMPLVEVWIKGFHRTVFLAMAATAQEALTLVLERLLAGEQLPDDDERLHGILVPLWSPTPPFDHEGDSVSADGESG